MDNSGKGSVFFMLGILTGSVIGLLFAPKSGKETRSDIQNYLQEAEKKFEEKKEEIKQATSKQLASIKTKVSETFQKEKERLEEETKKDKSEKA